MLLGGTSLLAHRSEGATPNSGSIDTTTPSITWQGASYPFGVNADPAQCPPAADPLNLLCDHFFLNINLASNFWQSNTGTVTVTINWPSSPTSNDFDLFVYRQSDGAQVGSSTAGGGETQEQVVLQAPIPGTPSHQFRLFRERRSCLHPRRPRPEPQLPHGWNRLHNRHHCRLPENPGRTNSLHRPIRQHLGDRPLGLQHRPRFRLKIHRRRNQLPHSLTRRAQAKPSALRRRRLRHHN
jgi:hypothetical protein